MNRQLRQHLVVLTQVAAVNNNHQLLLLDRHYTGCRWEHFPQRANAQRLVNSLRELGYEAFITDGPPYRVQTGAFSSESAQRYADELIKRGFEVTIVRPDNP